MQRELFQMSGPVVDASKISRNQASGMGRPAITLRLDQLSISAILALVLYVLIFSFGVEKGKGLALEEIRGEKAKQELISSQIASEPAEQKPQPTSPAPENSKIQAEKNLDGKYTIQLITFVSRSRAEKEVERLKKLGYQSFIIPAGKVFQVCVEAFKNQSEAREKLTRLKAQSLAPPDAYIRPLKTPVTL